MKIKALTSFSGIATMAADEIKEVEDKIAKDLIRAGYALEVRAEKPVEKPVVKAEKKKKAKTK